MLQDYMQEVYFSQIQEVVLSQIAQARYSLRIAVGWFTNAAIFEAVLAKARQEVDTQIVLLDDYLNRRAEGLPFQDLIAAGAKVYLSQGSRPLGHRFCVIDNATLLTGSYCWTYYSEHKSMENMMVISEDDLLVSQFTLAFRQIVADLPPCTDWQPYTMQEGLINDIYGLKQYLAEDVYFQSLILNKQGDDLGALRLMHHSTTIDEYKKEVQEAYIQSLKAKEPNELEQEQAEEEEPTAEAQEAPVYTSRGIGLSPAWQPSAEEVTETAEESEQEAYESYEAQEADATTYEAQNAYTEQEATPYQEPTEGAWGEGKETSAYADYSEAEPSLEAAVAESNPEADALVAQGEQAYQAGNYGEAKSLFLQAIGLQPSHAKAYLNMAIVSWREGIFHEQAEYAYQATQHDPQNPSAYNTLALAQDRMGNKVEAIQNYTQALNLSPATYSYLWNRGLALKAIGRFQEAFLDFKEVVRLCNQILMQSPDNQNAKMTAAAAAQAMGNALSI